MTNASIEVRIVSFSYRRGVPEDPSGHGGGFVFDCRGLPNPYWIEGLRRFSGRDAPVVEFFEEYRTAVGAYLDAAETLVRQMLEAFRVDGRRHLQVAFGCTGGQHRSVYMAERLAERLRQEPGVSVEVVHSVKSEWRT